MSRRWSRFTSGTGPCSRISWWPAYTFADTKLAGTVLTAKGAAIRIANHWFALRYTCQTGEAETVTAFEFTLGEEVPEGKWPEYNLAVQDEPAD
ncbi:DUF930 domain-containing protein [Rhizobium sp. CG5]|uniref:DUF930 domain-containing protein n=1 Tax=Rhizobium sp. CG5 TaxID=2726076 RepID=UPI00331C54D1